MESQKTEFYRNKTSKGNKNKLCLSFPLLKSTRCSQIFDFSLQGIIKKKYGEENKQAILLHLFIRFVESKISHNMCGKEDFLTAEIKNIK